MIWKFIVKGLLAMFGVRRSFDYVLRPLFMLFAIAGLNFAIKTALTNMSNMDLLIDTALTTLVGLPFVVICFSILLHQNQIRRNLSAQAQTDELTDLPNRRAFVRRAERALNEGRNGFFLIVDADHFKRVNDTLGHQMGDICLQAIADRIKSILRPDDLVGRIGGEEFGVVFFDRTLDDIQRLSNRLCFPIKVSIEGYDEPLRLTLSAGATEISDNDTVTALSKRADEALIAAKNNGRERMVLWRRAATRRSAA